MFLKSSFFCLTLFIITLSHLCVVPSICSIIQVEHSFQHFHIEWSWKQRNGIGILVVVFCVSRKRPRIMSSIPLKILRNDLKRSRLFSTLKLKCKRKKGKCKGWRDQCCNGQYLSTVIWSCIFCCGETNWIGILDIFIKCCLSLFLSHIHTHTLSLLS